MFRYSNWSALRCRALLLCFGSLTAVCLWISLSNSKIELRGKAQKPTGGDIQLYWAMTNGMQTGKSFYQSAYDELRARNYPTGSVFNWRTPFPMTLLAHLPSFNWGRGIIGAFAGFAVLLLYSVVRKECGSYAAIASMLFSVGALFPCFLSEVYILPDIWSSVLIAVSLGFYGRRNVTCAVVSGCAAPFFRDLAFAYPMLMLVYAMHHRQRGEAVGWILGVLAYLLFFANHVVSVQSLLGTSDVASVESWLRFGSLPFLLVTTQINTFLYVAPYWLTAIYFSVGMVGVIGWRSEWGIRVSLVVAAYLAFFFVAGQPFNNYWGILISPLMGIEVVAGVMGLRVLVRRAFFLKPEPVGAT